MERFDFKSGLECLLPKQVKTSHILMDNLDFRLGGSHFNTREHLTQSCQLLSREYKLLNSQGEFYRVVMIIKPVFCDHSLVRPQPFSRS